MVSKLKYINYKRIHAHICHFLLNPQTSVSQILTSVCQLFLRHHINNADYKPYATDRLNHSTTFLNQPPVAGGTSGSFSSVYQWPGGRTI